MALIGLYIVLIVLGLVLSVIHLGIVMLALWPMLGLAIFAAWIFLMFKAYNNETFKLPIIGELAAKQAGL